MKRGFISSSLVYSFIIIFLFITLSIITYNLNKEKLVTYIVDEAKKQVEGKTVEIEEVKAATLGDVFEFAYTGSLQKFVVPTNGTYKIELWGASTASTYASYTSGEIYLTKGFSLYVNVGGRGRLYLGGYNGGGNAGSSAAYGGGGATDVRVADQKFRYIKDYINGNDDDGYNRWSEIIAYDMYGANVAKSKPVTSSGSAHSSYPFTNISDGDIDSYALLNNYGGHYVEVDLGDEYQLSSIVIKHYYSSYTPVVTYLDNEVTLYNEDRSIINTVYNADQAGAYYEQASGTVYDPQLRSRIMVAAGSGFSYYGGSNGGGLLGYDGAHYLGSAYQGKGGGQNLPAQAPTLFPCVYNTNGGRGGFGFGGNGGINVSSGSGGGAGGGWYGGSGASGSCSDSMSAGGGSSYISGHNGCNSVDVNGLHTSSSVHYSGLSFAKTLMIDGLGYSWTNIKGTTRVMPTPTGTTYALGVGHRGDGYAKITLIK